MSTTALETAPSVPLLKPVRSAWVQTVFPPRLPIGNHFFHSDAADIGSQAYPSQASSAQPQAALRAAKATVPVVPSAQPQRPSTFQARPPSLVPSDLVPTRTRRRQAATVGSPRPAVDCGFGRRDPAPSPVKPPVATAQLHPQPRSPSPSSERLARPHRAYWVCRCCLNMRHQCSSQTLRCHLCNSLHRDRAAMHIIPSGYEPQ